MNSFKRSRSTGSSGRLMLAAAGCMYLSLCGVASAQNADGDVISLTAGIGVTRDSNVLRLADGQGVPGVYGTDKRGDTYLRGNLGIAFDRMISQQRLQANAEVEGFKYREYDDFDNIGYRAGVNYDWVIGRPFFGQIGARASRSQPTVQDRLNNQAGASRNEVDAQTLYLKGGVRLTPSWSVIAGWELERWRHSSQFYNDADADHSTFEAGVRFAPGTGLEVDLVGRRTDGDYKRDQLYAADGSPILVTGLRSDFKQNALLARVQYRPSDDSRIAGRIGYTNRKYDVGGSRDFKGLTTGFDIDLAQTGALMWRFHFSRDIIPDESAITASYADARTFRIAPIIRATGKIQVLPFVTYGRYTYDGDVGTTRREDKFTSFGATIDYEVRRNLNALLDLRREKRDSNLNGLDFSANIISLGLRARF